MLMLKIKYSYVYSLRLMKQCDIDPRVNIAGQGFDLGCFILLENNNEDFSRSY